MLFNSVAQNIDNKKDLRRAVSFRTIGGAEIAPGIKFATIRNFSLSSYNWSDNYQINGDTDLINNETVPKLVMTEIQPKKKVDWSKILSDATALERLPGVSTLMSWASTPAESLSQAYGSSYLNSLADKYSSSLSAAKKLLDITDLEDLIIGEEINTYEIPFFNNSYLKSETKDGWSTGSALDSVGKFAEIMNDGFQANIIKSPQWANANETGMDWESEFFLINSTLDDLHKNFRFVNALYPSTMWVRMGAGGESEIVEKGEAGLSTAADFVSSTTGAAIGRPSIAFARSPNIFRVVCPGRFKQLFVALDMEVTYEGNVRKMPLHTLVTDVAQVNENSLWPDAFRVRLTAKDLTPSCYNVYANYLMGHETVTVQ